MSSTQLSLSCLVSMPDEEFEVFSEEDLALLSRQFERMYTNWKNARRSSACATGAGSTSTLFMSARKPCWSSPSTSTI
jgi:hypothetical protein